MVALLKENSLPAKRQEPMPSLAPRLRLVPTDQSPLRLDLETPAEISELFTQRQPTNDDSAYYQAPAIDWLSGDLADLPDPQADTDDVSGVSHLETNQPSITPLFAAITALLILALLSFVRISQGAPPASSWDSLAPTPATATAPGVGETVRIVDVGDTLWAIAAEIAPESDRRFVVDTLAQRNGGSGLQVGQRLVIPAEFAAS